MEPDLGGVQPPVQTGSLSLALVGRFVTVQGRIEQATLLSAGCKSVVNDGSGPAAIWMPNALYGQLVDPEGWNVGGVVRVSGRVSEYEGDLEIVPQSPDAIVIVQRSLPASSRDVQIGNLSEADLGRRVTVEATVVNVEPFSAGVKCLLEDGSGRIILLLWQNVMDALPDKGALTVGGYVRASGWVDEYRGELEIIPGLVYDVVVLGKTGAP
jgi:DNA/RNA endonuclease YhcR with UshA esterase domain